MKSLNVRKIAALAAGTAMLGAALAGAQANVDAAGVGSYKFFSGSEPNVKIVVGMEGKDALAAAIIAAKIANLARSEREITVVGKDGVGCTVGGAGGAGSCTLSNEKVVLEITTPGVNPQVAYQMKTYIAAGQSTTAGIAGVLDADITDDRTNDDISAGILATDGTSGGRRVTFIESPALAWRGTVTDPVSAKSYTQEERYFLYAQSNFYNTDKQVEAMNGQVAYETIFTNPIQVCTEFTPDDSTCSEQYNTPRHRMRIKFLGQDWILFSMTGFDTGLTPGTQDSGSSIAIGKEVQFKEFMQIGDKISAPNGVSVELSSISGFGYGTAAQPYASFNVYDASGNKIDTATLQEGGADEYNKYGIIIKLFKAFPGVNQVNYAQVFVFSDKLTLNDGQVLDTNNQDWNVRLITGGSAYGASLARIQLTRQVISNFLKAGEGVNIVNKPAQMRFTFSGVESVPTDDLVFSGVGGLTLASSSTTSITGNFVRITSAKSNAFQFAGTSDSTNTVYALVGNPGGSAPSYGDPANGTFVYQIPGSSNYRTYYSTGGNGTKHFVGSNAIVGSSLSSAGVTLATALGCNLGNQTITGFSMTVAPGNSTAFSGNWTAVGNMTVLLGPAAAFNVTTGVTITNSTGTFTGNSTCGEPAGGNAWVVFGGTANGTINGGTNAVYRNDLQYLYGTVSQILRFAPGGIDGTATDPGQFGGNGATFAVQEYVLDTESGTPGAFMLDVGRTGSGETPQFLGSTAIAQVGYEPNLVYAGEGDQGNATSGFLGGILSAEITPDSGFVSPRGSVATISTSTATIKYATVLSHALYTLSSAAANVTGATASGTFNKGETALDQGGYKIKVLDVTATAAATGGATGGACTVTGLDGLRASDARAVVVSDVGAGLVVYDNDPAAASANAVSVGGGLVNSRTRAAFGDASLDVNAAPTVKVQGNTVGVWGGNQASTRAAAEALVAWLDSNKDRLAR